MAQWPDGPGVVTFPDGRRLRGRRLRRPGAPDLSPEFAVYLVAKAPEATRGRTAGWSGATSARRAPTDDAVVALREAYERAAHERVEIACSGGVGRTGTALAAVAVLAGVAPAEAVAWVRQHYHPRAVETSWQRRWVARLPPAARSV